MRQDLVKQFDESFRDILRKMAMNSHKETACISPALDKVLLIIGLYEGVRIKKLASILHITSGAATQEVISLENNGLLTRSPNPEDHRETLVHLTEQGRQALAKIQTYRIEQLGEFFAPLDDTDLQTFVTLMAKVSKAHKEGEQL